MFPRIEWEDSPCPLCGGADASHKIEAPEPAPAARARWFLVVECRHCSLCYTNPRPSAACLARLYPQDRPLPPEQAVAPRRWWRGPRTADPLARLWPMLDRGRLLNVGHGISSFLRRLHQRGRPFMAVNLSAPAVDFLGRAWGVTALAGTLPHPELARQNFNVITFFGILEHVHRPLELLRAARALLAPGGVLIVAVPNIDSLPFRWFGADWPGLNLPRHLTHFTPRTLRLMLHQADLRLHRLTALRHSGWLRTSARRTRAPWAHLLKGKALASLASWYTAALRRKWDAGGSCAVRCARLPQRATAFTARPARGPMPGMRTRYPHGQSCSPSATSARSR